MTLPCNFARFLPHGSIFVLDDLMCMRRIVSDLPLKLDNPREQLAGRLRHRPYLCFSRDQNAQAQYQKSVFLPVCRELRRLTGHMHFFHAISISAQDQCGAAGQNRIL